MMNDCVSIDRRAGAADVRLIRSVKLNALDGKMTAALVEAGESLAADRSVRAAVISGWATLALRARKSVRWVADQLGHADPAMTLNVYAHAMPEEEADLSFADFDAPRQPYTAPAPDARPKEENAVDSTGRQRSGNLYRETGPKPPTLSLGN